MKRIAKILFLITVFAWVTSVNPLLAQDVAEAAAAEKGFSVNTDTILMMLAVFLVLPILILAKLVFFEVKLNLEKKAKDATLSVVVLLLGMQVAHAEGSSLLPGFNYGTWIIVIVILLELLIIAVLGTQALKLMRQLSPSLAEKESSWLDKTWLADIWQKMNKFRPIEEEGELDTGHTYDGIKELDNVTPPWFTMGFAASILFSIGYLWVYHVSKSAPLQEEEYRKEVAIAEAAHAEFLKTQANNVDETNVALLTDAGSLAGGKKIFETYCAACHKNDGGGSVGPNLTDDYWLHGGSIQDVFKTVKYGVPDKGMIAWKDDLSPNQIAQVASYIKSLKGSNPPGAKEPQGELYTEGGDATAQATSSDSTTSN